MLVEWIDRAVAELPVESLPDEQVLTLCDMQMESEQQEVLSDFLARDREFYRCFACDRNVLRSGDK